jgi:uncharacterized membrane protein
MTVLDSADRVTLVLGAACGSRSMIGPTIVAHALRHRAERAPQPARALAHPRAALVLGMLSAGEAIGDKMPGIPARTSPPAFGGRIAAGVLVGAAIAAASGSNRLRGALIGGAAAAVSTVLTYRARHWLGSRARIPDRLIAVVEDALVLRIASGASAGVRRAAAGG